MNFACCACWPQVFSGTVPWLSCLLGAFVACVYLALIPVIYISSVTCLEFASGSVPGAFRVSCDTCVRPRC